MRDKKVFTLRNFTTFDPLPSRQVNNNFANRDIFVGILSTIN